MAEHEVDVLQAAHQRTQQETEQVQDIGGLTYLEHGQGVPVVFLHGIGGAARQFAPQVAHFGQRYRYRW